MARKTIHREPISDTTSSIVVRTLEKIALILLRAGLDSPRSEFLLRSAFVLAASKNARLLGRRITQSQIALLAGVNRVDVRKILAGEKVKNPEQGLLGKSRIGRVLEAWSTDAKFTDSKGRPKALSFQGPNNQFEKLVRKYGRDITAKTLSDSLIRTGQVFVEGGRLTLNESVVSDQSNAAAALADLNFLCTHLSAFDLHTGRRTLIARNLDIEATDAKVLKLIQRKALTKIETTLSSINSLNQSQSAKTKPAQVRRHRLFIATTVSTDMRRKKR